MCFQEKVLQGNFQYFGKMNGQAMRWQAATYGSRPFAPCPIEAQVRPSLCIAPLGLLLQLSMVKSPERPLSVPAQTVAADQTPIDNRTAQPLDGEVGLDATLDAAAGPPAAAAQSGEQLPFPRWERYQITSFLGAGGMGAVYKARDPRLRRTVAIKLLRSGQAELNDTRHRRHFEREARAQARLEHPHICKIYEIGEVEGQPYIAMQFINGSSLLGLIQVMTREEKVKAIQKVAEALHTAHSHSLIHRDIKPGNIMVERRPDGSYWPYLMDFGLVKETDSNSQTSIGAVQGTPSYMSPEQVRGDSKAHDLRVDVYGLGATLYCILCGRPPFIGGSTDILLSVLTEDPPRLQTFEPTIPAALETIVLKCLEKQPARRYQSAQDLATDLGRLLDGRRIMARPPSLTHRAVRFAQRHKLLVASGTAALLASLSLGSIALRIRLQAVAQARLAQELGQDIKEVELFMRTAHGLPLHDIAREQAVVRNRMARISQKLNQATPQAAAALYYALGRGHLVLREYTQAQTALERAWQGGYRSPEARLALGLTLGERYRQELDRAQRVGEKSWIATRERQLEAEYLRPALDYLEGSSSSVEVPAYIQGLLAFYKKQHEQALSLARRAQLEAPWLAEPIKLEGDVYQMEGITRQNSGHLQESRELLLRAAERHHVAASISRSDSSIHNAEAVDWIRIMEADADTGKALEQVEREALIATEAAITAAPNAPYGLQLRSWAYWRMGWTKLHRGQDADPDLKQAVELAKRALALDASDWQSYYYYALALSARADIEYEKGNDGSTMNKSSIDALQKALEMNRNFAWAWNDLGVRHLVDVGFQFAHGLWDSQAYAQADNCFMKAAELDPNYPQARVNRLCLQLMEIDFLNQQGKPIDEKFTQAMHWARQTLSLKEDFLGLANLASLELKRIETMVYSGAASNELLAQAADAIGRAQAMNAKDIRIDALFAFFHLLRATNDLHAARDPAAAISEGLQAIAEGQKKNASDYDLLTVKSLLLTLAGRSSRAAMQADTLLADSVSAAEQVVALRPGLAGSHDSLCQTLRYRAAAHRERRRVSPQQATIVAGWIERALHECATALAINPARATAHGNQGALLLLQAQSCPNPKVRQRLATQAAEALGRALSMNNRLAPDYQVLLSAAQALSAVHLEPIPKP